MFLTGQCVQTPMFEGLSAPTHCSVIFCKEMVCWCGNCASTSGAAFICSMSEETKETDHSLLWSSGSSGKGALSIGTHGHRPLPASASLSPHVMLVTWLPGKQLSKSQSDFYF